MVCKGWVWPEYDRLGMEFKKSGAAWHGVVCSGPVGFGKEFVAGLGMLSLGELWRCAVEYGALRQGNNLTKEFLWLKLQH